MERQYVCHYEGCGKKFLDSLKLKRHFLIHTGERDYVCPHQGCGVFFGFQPEVTHENTLTRKLSCPYRDCGKRYAYEYKLKNHIASQHEKNSTVDVVKTATPPEKITKTSKPTAGAYGSATSDRPYVCPYEGCDKACIHEYKLKLLLRREHPGHMSDKNATPNVNSEMDDASDQHASAGKRVSGKGQKQCRPKPNLKMPPAKIMERRGSSPSSAALNVVKKQWPAKEETFEEEDSEETEEEDRENGEDGWRYGENNEENDEETEYED